MLPLAPSPFRKRLCPPSSASLLLKLALTLALLLVLVIGSALVFAWIVYGSFYQQSAVPQTLGCVAYLAGVYSILFALDKLWLN